MYAPLEGLELRAVALSANGLLRRRDALAHRGEQYEARQ